MGPEHVAAVSSRWREADEGNPSARLAAKACLSSGHGRRSSILIERYGKHIRRISFS